MLFELTLSVELSSFDNDKSVIFEIDFINELFDEFESVDSFVLDASLPDSGTFFGIFEPAAPPNAFA